MLLGHTMVRTVLRCACRNGVPRAPMRTGALAQIPQMGVYTQTGPTHGLHPWRAVYLRGQQVVDERTRMLDRDCLTRGCMW